MALDRSKQNLGLGICFFGLFNAEAFFGEFYLVLFHTATPPPCAGGQWLSRPGQELISVTDKFSTKLDPPAKKHSSTRLKNQLYSCSKVS